MGQRSIPIFCELCGRRFDVVQPSPGHHDAGLDRIKASFRYCSICDLFVGRTCCWNPEALACIVDAPAEGVSALVVRGSGPPASEAWIHASGALASMSAAVDALAQMGELTELSPQGMDGDRQVQYRAWSEAWMATGWAIARVETSRDAAAKALWHASPEPARAGPGGDGALLSLEERYGGVRADVEALLQAAGASLARRRLSLPNLRVPRVQLPSIRVPRTAVLARLVPARRGIGALAVAGVLAIGAAVLLRAGTFDPFALGAGGPPTPEGAVLGGQAPSPSASATPGAAGSPARTVVGRLDFDEIPVGALAGGQGEIGSVRGRTEVVSFPSPFDRSVRMAGAGTHRFCAPVEAAAGGATALELDFYLEGPMSSGRLILSVPGRPAEAWLVRVPLGALGTGGRDAWRRLTAERQPGETVALTTRDEATGRPQTIELPAITNAAFGDSVCLGVDGMPKTAALMIDTVEIRR